MTDNERFTDDEVDEASALAENLERQLIFHCQRCPHSMDIQALASVMLCASLTAQLGGTGTDEELDVMRETFGRMVKNYATRLAEIEARQNAIN